MYRKPGVKGTVNVAGVGVVWTRPGTRILGDTDILSEVQIHPGCHRHLRPPQSGLWFEGWQVMPDELVSWASRKTRELGGPRRGLLWEAAGRADTRKNTPFPGWVWSAAGGMDLVSLGSPRGGWSWKWTGQEGGPLSPQRILLARTGHSKQRWHREPVFLSHLSWESAGLQSVRATSFGVWGAPEPQVQA